MWKFFDNKMLYIEDGSNVFVWVPFSLEKCRFSGEIHRVPAPGIPWQGYDDWVQSHPPEDEISLIKDMIQKAEKDSAYRGHICGISLAETAHILREYYKKQGYEDILAKNYTLPMTVQITASISLRHALWCEKDKKFLNTKDSHQMPYGMVTPPIRGSHDLRILQQALRMNCIMGIEVFPGDEDLIDSLVSSEILPPFSVSQMIQFRWEKLLREKS